MDNQPIQKENMPVSKEKKTTLWADLLDYLEIFVVAICVVVAIFSFSGFRLCTVSGPSMENTLFHGEKLITANLFYTPKRGDVVVFHQTSENENGFNEPIVKRVIGVAGDTVTIDYQTWTVTVTDTEGNARVLDESAYRKLLSDRRVTSDLNYPITLGENELFVMGDKRNNSMDSRDSRIGVVNEKEIIGKVCLRAFPFNKFGTVK